LVVVVEDSESLRLEVELENEIDFLDVRGLSDNQHRVVDAGPQAVLVQQQFQGVDANTILDDMRKELVGLLELVSAQIEHHQLERLQQGNALKQPREVLLQ
jgi:hypothetical protein